MSLGAVIMCLSTPFAWAKFLDSGLAWVQCQCRNPTVLALVWQTALQKLLIPTFLFKWSYRLVCCISL